MEIVSEPDMRSAEEARLFLVKLRQILRYTGASAGNMEEGNFRCDANISLRPVGSSDFGAKVEVKNMNSFRSVARALEFEVERQTGVLESGARIPQETRGWVETEGRTVSQRSKEFAHDYRYFPEPDLPPVEMTADFIEEIRSKLPELADVKRERFERQYGLGDYEARLLTEERASADYFEEAANAGRPKDKASRAKGVANWMLGDFAHALDGRSYAESEIKPPQLAALVDLTDSVQITSKAAKTVFQRMLKNGGDPAEIVESEGLAAISGEGEIARAATGVIEANENAVADFRKGKDAALKFLVGQLMRETRGRANPQLAEEALRRALDEGTEA